MRELTNWRQGGVVKLGCFHKPGGSGPEKLPNRSLVLLIGYWGCDGVLRKGNIMGSRALVLGLILLAAHGQQPFKETHGATAVNESRLELTPNTHK